MEQELISLGLTDTEAKIYLAVLELGPSSAAIIAKQANIKRTTGYSALEYLIQKGLVSEIANTKEKLFKAEEPDKLTRLTRKMRRQVIEAEIGLEKLLPGLKAIQKKLIEVPKVTFYQNIEGIKTIIEQAAFSAEPWHYFGSTEQLIKSTSEKLMNEFALEVREKRKKINPPVNYIITDGGYYKIKIFQKFEPQLRQVKIFPPIAKAKSAFVIFGGKLGVLSYDNMPFGAIIESREVAELVKMLFEIIWNSLPEEKTTLRK